MRYTYIKLVNYKRFPLSDSAVFERSFDSKLVMITGPNGSGKSSLLSALSPLPADKVDFYKDGYQEVRLEMEGEQYTLISDFTGKSPKYSFLRNGVEMNPSSNVSSQRDLACMYFSITPVVHEILTGGESFTEMSLITRKKLFNSITHLNIDGIIESYEKLKEELKNNDYLVKTLSAGLLREKEKLLDAEKERVIRDRLTEIHRHVARLLVIRTEIYHLRNSKGLDDTALTYSRLVAKLVALKKQHYLLLSAHPYDRLEEITESYRTRETVIAVTLKGLYKTLEGLLYTKKSLELSKVSDVNALTTEASRLTELVTRVESRLEIIPKDIENVQRVLADLAVLERSLPEILEKLPPNENRRLSKVNYISMMESKNLKLTTLTELMKEHSSLTAELRELDGHKSLNCPNCHHTWLPHEVSGRTEKAKLRLTEINSLRGNTEEAVRTLSKDIAEQETYLQHLSQFNSLYTATKQNAKVVWELVFSRSLLHTNPSSIMSVIVNAITECNSVVSCDEYKKTIADIRERLVLLDVSRTTSYDDNASSILAVESEIRECMNEQSDCKANLQNCGMAKSVYNTMGQMKGLLDSGSKAAQAAAASDTVNAVVREIDNELSLCKISVIEIEAELGRNSTVLSAIAALTEQIADAEENKKVLTILTDELSPKNGLIAKTISNFLNVVIKNINSVIAGVWDYRMVLRAINLEDDALNYRFKVEVEDRLVIDDISKVSSGMKEIINLAMKITMYKLLGLEGYPMKLDEFGVKLDTVHRAKITDIIFKMLNSTQFSQIFLITHLDLAYSNFKDTELIEF